MNPLKRLTALHQSVWLDDIRRRWLVDGTLARLIAEDGITGVTSNPAIFAKAIAHHDDYDDEIADLAQRGVDGPALYETLAVDDIRQAADLLRGVYEDSGGRDGYVSLEVSPHHAHYTAATIVEAERLASRVARPNLMIKVPATDEGLPAIRALIANGINVNVTLLFGMARYRAVVDAYQAGLEERVHAHAPLNVTSVASFFVSRIDTLIDAKLDRLDTPQAQALRGQAAIACARLAYQERMRLMTEPRWQALAERGARPQRLLWASTSTKDRRYSDVKYIDALAAPQTVTTVPHETLAAYRNHGDPAVRITDDLCAMRALPTQLASLGIDLDEVAAQLEEEGIRKFSEPYDHLLAALSRRATELMNGAGPS